MNTHEGTPQVISFSAVVGRRNRRLTRSFPIPPPPVPGVIEYLEGVHDGAKLRRLTGALLVLTGIVIGFALAVWIGVGGGGG